MNSLEAKCIHQMINQLLLTVPVEKKMIKCHYSSLNNLISNFLLINQPHYSTVWG